MRLNKCFASIFLFFSSIGGLFWSRNSGLQQQLGAFRDVITPSAPSSTSSYVLDSETLRHKFFESFKVAYKNQDYAKATDELKKLLAYDIKMGNAMDETLFILGICYDKQKNYHQAIAAFSKIPASSSLKATAGKNMIKLERKVRRAEFVSLFKEWDFANALEKITNLAKFEEDHGIRTDSSLYNKGLCYQGLQDHEEAIKVLQEIPVTSKYHNQSQLLLHESQLIVRFLHLIQSEDQLPQALEAINQVLEFEKTHHFQNTDSALLNKAFCLVKLGRKKQALAIYDKIRQKQDSPYQKFAMENYDLTSGGARAVLRRGKQVQAAATSFAKDVARFTLPFFSFSLQRTIAYEATCKLAKFVPPVPLFFAEILLQAGLAGAFAAIEVGA